MFRFPSMSSITALLIFTLPSLSLSQVTTTATSFNSIVGEGTTVSAVMSENAVVSRSVRVDSVDPTEGTYMGGTHLHVIGEGFSVDTYGGSNDVQIGLPDFDYLIDLVHYPEFKGAWSQCDVIEGACTVDCEYARVCLCLQQGRFTF